MQRLSVVAITLLMWSALACAQVANIDAMLERKLAAPGSSLLQLETATSAGAKIVVDIPTPAFRDEVTLTAEIIAAIKRRIAANTVAKALLLSDANRTEIARFAIAAAPPGTQPAPAVGSVAGGRGQQPQSPLPSRNECKEAALAWQKANPDDWNQGKDTLLVLFDREATFCYESSRQPHVGDTVYVGVVVTADDDIRAKVQFSQCSREPVEPTIYISGDRSLFVTQSGGDFDVQIVEARRCSDKEITLTASITAGTDTVQGTRPISFYERFRGTLQIGALFTDLHENDFGLRMQDGQNVIFNQEATSNGPEYVASLVVYGLPNYFIKDGFRRGYRGRDILNDNGWADRVGLAILAGLDDPGDRFGIGVSFEVVYGINVFVARQWFRQQELVGLSEGDAFAGTEDQIATRRDWQSDTSVGVSFDIRYLLALFKGQ